MRLRFHWPDWRGRVSAAGRTVVENDLCGGNSTRPLIDLRTVNSLFYFFGRRCDAQFTQPSDGAPVGGGAVLVILPLPTSQAETVALQSMPPLGAREGQKSFGNKTSCIYITAHTHSSGLLVHLGRQIVPRCLPFPCIVTRIDTKNPLDSDTN